MDNHSSQAVTEAPKEAVTIEITPLPIILLCGILIVAGIFVFRPKHAPVQKQASDLTVTNLESSGLTLKLNGKSVSEYREPSTDRKLAYNYPKTWNLSNVETVVKRGNGSVLRFEDGSERAVNATTLKTMPADIRLRATYERKD